MTDSTFFYAEDYYIATDYYPHKVFTQKIYHLDGLRKQEVIGFDVHCDAPTWNKPDTRWKAFLQDLAESLDMGQPLSKALYQTRLMYRLGEGHLCLFENDNGKPHCVMVFSVNPAYIALVEATLCVVAKPIPHELPFLMHSGVPGGVGVS